MEAFKTHAGVAIPIDIPNCDTDQIVPARFLRRERSAEDYDRYLFHDLRFNEDGSENTDFIFNDPRYAGVSVLVADINWGCGSSRENAAYVLVANGIRAVIAPSFGDIHYNNCTKHGILPVRLSEEDCKTLRRQLRESPGAEVALCLDTQTVTGPDQSTYSFEIEPFDKHRLMNGVDEIALTLGHDSEISAFENEHKNGYGWLA